MDLKQDLKPLYSPSSKTVSVVDIPPMAYLMIDGYGDPNTAQRYREAVSALYTLAYAVRTISKDAGQPFVVMPLEGLWWWTDGRTKFELSVDDKAEFQWTMMMLQPPHITSAMVNQARQALQHKRVPRLDRIRFELFHEGEAVQILHIGSYANEGPTVEKLHQYIEEQGWQLRGKHHEIYLNNPDRVPAQKLKTIIRQPFKQ